MRSSKANDHTNAPVNRLNIRLSFIGHESDRCILQPFFNAMFQAKSWIIAWRPENSQEPLAALFFAQNPPHHLNHQRFTDRHRLVYNEGAARYFVK
ncbi:MAG: hypothetical protein AAFO73_08760 [Pseudomonadota bacterium]